MDVGMPQREIYVEPLTLPAPVQPSHMPEPEPLTLPEPTIAPEPATEPATIPAEEPTHV